MGGGGAGGIHYAGTGTLTITDSIIESNTTTKNAGGGLYLISATAVITDSTFKSNTSSGDNGGGGIYMGGASPSLTISKSSFQGNIANGGNGNSEGGGLRITSGTVTSTNSIISGNITGTAYWAEGGGIYVSGATMNVYNSTIGGNWANRQGGGIHVASGTTTIKNSILWDNTAGGGSNHEIYGSPTVTYTDVEGGFTGTGNINLDPNFVTPAQAGSASLTIGGNFHIQTGSNVVDQGTTDETDGHPVPVDDIDNDNRPLVSGIDMGADEKE